MLLRLAEAGSRPRRLADIVAAGSASAIICASHAGFSKRASAMLGACGDLRLCSKSGWLSHRWMTRLAGCLVLGNHPRRCSSLCASPRSREGPASSATRRKEGTRGARVDLPGDAAASAATSHLVRRVREDSRCSCIGDGVDNGALPLGSLRRPWERFGLRTLAVRAAFRVRDARMMAERRSWFRREVPA